jgi:anaerobic magnesium-protoporphyrin IX monomethyl ester cyclase
MARILLAHSYFLKFDPKEYKAMMPYPPLGTLYAASVLRSLGFDVALHDTMLRCHENEIAESLAQHKPDVVVIYDDGFNYLTKMCLSRMREAAYSMTQCAKEFGCTVIVFSSDATDHVEAYLHRGADYVICGEAEATLAELAKYLSGDSSVSSARDINGVAFLENGDLCRTRKRALVTDLDALPFPAWDMVDLEQYRTVWEKKHGYFSLNLVTTRGCPYHCNWCAKPMYGQVYHSRSPLNVVQEMKLLKRTAHPAQIWFADDIFGLKPGWIKTFDEVVHAEGAVIPFKCQSRVDLLLQEDTIHHLKHAGCQTVWVGAESGSQKILDAMEKGTTVEQIKTATRMLHEAGIRVGYFLQFGYPGEGKEEIEKTITMVKECMPDEIGISVSYPLPGTRFYDRVRSQLSQKQNWVVSQDLDLMFAGTYVPDFYRVLHRVVHKKFSIWRGKTELRAMLLGSETFRQWNLRHMAGMIYSSLTLPVELQRLRELERVIPSW